MQQNVKTYMLKHSEAKVELYKRYLGIYLNILSKVNHIKKIHIYDLMCGEGRYTNDLDGSPIVAIKTIKNLHSRDGFLPKIEVWLNDKDKSEIEPNKYKIDRVKEYCSEIFAHENLDIKYSKKDYSALHFDLLSKIEKLKADKFLLFIDPYGYKEVNPEYLKDYLKNKNTEIILFLPISYMYRFANKALSEEKFTGGEALKKILSALFKKREVFTSTDNFIEKLRKKFYEYFGKKIFVDNFKLERDNHNIYCLFFFTPHPLGLEKMLEAKWTIDEQEGRCFKLEREKSLFSSKQHAELSNYPNRLKSYIESGEYRTNSDLYLYGLKNGFLPKHTNAILKDWRKNKSSFKVYFPNGNEITKNAFYISHRPKEEIRFKFN